MIKPWFTIINKGGAEPSEVSIYGEIGTGWDGSAGVDAKAFKAEWDKLPENAPINLRIHSPGGSVFDGLAIYNMVSRRRAQVTAHVDGVALSAASFIAMGAGKVIMPKTSRMMIHDAQGFSIGDSEHMRDMADLLDRESDRIADIYAGKTGKTREKMRALMKATTWMDGEEAVKNGFADEVTDHSAVTNDFDLSRFRCVPEELKTTAPTPANSGAETTTVMNTNQVAIPATPPAATPSAPQNAAPAAAPTPAPQNIVSIEEFNAVKAQLKAEREARITARFDVIAAANPSIVRDEWLPRALKDEAILDSLAKIPATITEPVATREPVKNYGNPLIEEYNSLAPVEVVNLFDPKRTAVPQMSLAKAQKRIAMRKQRGGELVAAFDRHMPRMSNTISSTLKPDALVDALVVVANNRLAPLSAFSRLFTVDAMRPGASLAVKKATAGSTGQSNPSSWESGDSTLDVISVSLAHKTQSFQISQSDANYGFQLDDLAQINAQAFANLLSDVYTAIMTVANYGATTNIGAAAAFDADGLKPVLALAKNYRAKNLILDGGHLAYLLPTNKESFRLGEQGAYGFDLIGEQNRWTSAATNAVGFVCAPDALAVASGSPALSASNQFETYGTFQIAEIGLTVLYTVWFNTATRIRWASYETMFGAAAGDTTQAEVLASA